MTDIIATSLVWKPITYALKDLKPYEKNPRKITAAAYQKLKQSLQQDGYHKRLIADVDGTIIGGHQRIKALKELGFETVEVLTPSRKLSQEEFERINIRDNILFGAFDAEILNSRFDAQKLEEWGVPDEQILQFPSPLSDDEIAELAMGKEFDETAAEGVEMVTCPHCGKQFPV